MVDFAPEWQPLAVAAATLSLLVVAAAYVAAVVFDSAGLKAWAKNEAIQAVASAVLVGLLLVLANGLSQATQDLAGGKEPIAFANEYLESLNGNLTVVTEGLTVFQLALSALQETEVSVEPIGIGVKTKPLAGLEPIVKETRNTLEALSFLKTINELQRSLFEFIQATMMFYFLPIGVVLRSFPLTRPAGAFFVAVSIGLYFVLPLTYVLNAAALARENAVIAADTAALKSFSDQVNLSALNFMDPTGLSAFIAELLTKAVWNVAVDAVQSLRTLVADLTVQTTFFPIFNAAVVFLISRELYRVLRSENRWFSWN